MHRIIFWICSQNNNYYFRPQFDLSLYLDLVHVFDKSKHYLSQLAKEFQFFLRWIQTKMHRDRFLYEEKNYNRGLVEINLLCSE